MNKISVNKTNASHRVHSIIHKYQVNKVKQVPVVRAQKATVKPVTRTIINRDSRITYKQEIQQTQQQVRVNRPIIDRPIISSKPNEPFKIRKQAKGSFDPKVNSIRGVGKGKFLIMFAPGPSILEAEIERLKGINKIDTMTINKPDMRVWETDYWLFCDRTQYNRNQELFNKYQRKIINTEHMKIGHPGQIKIKSMHGTGFSTDMTKGFYIGRSSTFSAMQVAAWMEYEKVFIFGCDMARVNGKLHSYGVNPDVPEKTRESRFSKEAEFYMAASKIMGEDQRNKYYFCSSYNPWPFVDNYHRLNQKEAVNFILNCVKEIENGV